MKEFLPVLRSSQLFSGVTDGEAEAMLACLEAKSRRFAKDAFLLHAGDTVSAVGLVLEGSVLMLREDVWGNRHILARAGAGQSFAAAAACAPGARAPADVVAETPVTVLFCDVRRILTMCGASCAHHSRMIRNLLGELAGKNLSLGETLTHMGQRTTRAKLMSYLSAQARLRGGYEFDIPFSRQQLADYLAVERSGLSAELGRMREEGLLEFHRNHFLLKV